MSAWGTFGRAQGPTGPPQSVPSFGPSSSTPSLPSFGSAAAAPPHRSPNTPPPRRPGAPQRMPSPPMGFESGYNGWSSSFRAPGVNRGSGGPTRMRSPPLGFDSTRPGGLAASDGSYSWGCGSKSPYKDYDAPVHDISPASQSVVATQNYGAGTIPILAQFQGPGNSTSPPLLRNYVFRSAGQVAHTSPSDGLFHDDNHQDPQMTRAQSVYGNNGPVNDFIRPVRDQRPALSSASHRRLPGNSAAVMASKDMPSESPNVAPYYFGRNFGTDFTDVSDAHTLKRARSPLSPPTSEASKDISNRMQNNARTPSPPKFRASSPLLGEAVRMKPVSHPANKRTRSPPRPSSDQMLQADLKIFEDDTEREMKAKERRLARFKVELEEKPQSNSVNAGQIVSSNASSSSLEPREKYVGSYATESSGGFPICNVPSDIESQKSARIIGLCPDMCPQSERQERERKGDLDQYERVEGDRNQTTEFLAVKKYNRTAERETSLIRPLPVLQRTMDYLLNLLYQPYNDQFLGLYNFLWDRMRAIRMDLRMQHIFNEAAITMLEQMIRLHIIAMHEFCEYTKGEGFSEGFDAHLNIEQMNKASVELFQLYDDHRKKGIILPTEKEFRGYYALLKLDKHPGYKVEPSELSLELVKMTPEIRQTPEVVFARGVARACRIGNFIAFFRLARKATYLQGCLMHAHFAKLRTQALASLHSGLQINQGIPVAHVAKWLGMEDEDIEGLLEYHGFLIKDFEEPFMVKEGPFLNSDKDYRTNSSELVKLKRSETIIDDVLSSHAVSFPLKETEKVQHPKEEIKKIHFGNIFNTNSKLIQSVVKEGSISTSDEGIDDFRAVPSHKDNALEPVLGQETKIGHQLATPNLFPQNFLGHSSPTSQQTPGRELSPRHSTLVQDPSDIQPMASSVSFPWSSSFHSSLDTHSMTSPKATPQSSSKGHGFFDSQQITNLEFSPANFSGGNKTTGKQPPEIEMAGKPGHGDIFQDSPRINRPYGISETFSRAVNGDVPSSSGQLNHEVESFSYPGADFSGDLDMVNDCDKNLDSHPGHENIEDMVNDEVAEAKLKLIVRLWKRRSSKLKELREHRELAANAALESLSLGPPIRNTESPPASLGNFDIDCLMYERYKKHVRSWSRLNVPDVVSSVLRRRNPDASCLCWKTVLCSNIDSEDEVRKKEVAHQAADSWLRSKLMPARESSNDDSDLVISIPGLSIWKRWLPSESGIDLTCLTCVKDAKCGALTDTLCGASGVVFLLSEDTPWEIQKIKLHNLLMSLPAGSCLPLLILGGYFDKEELNPSSKVIENLALHDIDRSRISNFLVSFLAGDHTLERGVFFSEEQLIKGLQWLASESPHQPVLCLVNTRDLVLTHLDNYLDTSDNEVGPNHCISVFNEALNQSIEKVASAAAANHNGWPFPEISLLEQVDQYMLQLCLPSIGWSASASIEPLVGALRDCSLPMFSDDLSWLKKGSNLGHQIEKQRSLLEHCLTRYLTDSSKMMGHELATKEAVIMVQKYTRLEFHNLSYYLVPQWVQIFRRIYNWRLMTLSRGKFSSAYILKQHYDSQSSSAISMRNESRDSAPLFLEQPSLDELLAVGCSTHFSGTDQSLPSASQSVPEVGSGTVDVTGKTSETSVDKSSLVNYVMDASDSVAHQSSELRNKGGEVFGASSEVTAGIESLNDLLQQCNILQNTIGQKLSIYF